MSALLIVIMSGLTMLGVSMMEPSESIEEDNTDPTDETIDDVGEDGSSPLSEAERLIEEEAAAEAAAAASATADTASAAAQTSSGVIVAGSSEGNLIQTEEGNDIIDAGAGDDTIEAGLGEDTVNGSLGNDIIYGTSQTGPDDGVRDVLGGAEGDDTIYMGATDEATGGEGADTFVRLESVASRILINDFDDGSDMIVVQHQSDTPPVIDDQRVASDGLIIELSDGSQIELARVGAPIDPSLVSFVDTR